MMKRMNMNWRGGVVATMAIVLLPILLVGARASATTSFVCNHPDVRGGWGALDLGCDADQFGDLSRIQFIYPKFVYDRRAKDVSVENEYITNMNAIIRKVAHDYYVKRVPDAKPDALEAWMRAAVAVGAHESMLSHFRMSADNRYKLMTGDHLVSHGVMQVNQEFHANKSLDSSFDLVGNIVSALDTYFNEWTAAVAQGCFAVANGKAPSPEVVSENRARSAYSAYNGGHRALCRFADSKSVYKSHDDAFLTMYRDQPWFKHVTDAKRVAPINVKCLMEGDDLCAVAKPARNAYIKLRPLILGDGKTCLTSDGTNFTCTTDMRVFSCLAKIDPTVLENDPLKMDKAPKTAKITVVKDREPLCMNAVKGLFKVGTMIILQKEIVMRESIGGAPVGRTLAGRIYQVEDYDLRLGGKTERYYKIKTSGKSEGWIFGGSDSDHAEWLVQATEDQIADAAATAGTAKSKNAAVAKNNAGAKNSANAKSKNAGLTPLVLQALPTMAQAADHSQIGEEDDTGDDSDVKPILPVKGSVIEIIKEDGIALRAVAGESETTVPVDQLSKGARLTVEDVKNMGTENQMYLKVSEGGKTGWIYVGRTFPDVTVTKWIKLWN
jgi:hypothetical protein